MFSKLSRSHGACPVECHKKNYIEVKNAVRRCIEDDPGVVERYFEWLEDSVEEVELRSVLNEILREEN